VTRTDPFQERPLDVAHGNGDEVRLPEDVGLELHPRGELGRDIRQRGIQSARQVQGIRAGLLLDAQDHGGPAHRRTLPALGGLAD
jgi:hypothetical protein